MNQAKMNQISTELEQEVLRKRIRAIEIKIKTKRVEALTIIMAEV